MARKPSPRRQPTILDVASLAGVSKSSVSNVIRGVDGVSEQTRLRVQEAIDELGYRPNVLARHLVQQQTNVLGVVVGDLANPFFAEMAKAVEKHAASRGYTAMFCNTEGDAESELAGVESLLEHRVAGFIFLASSADSRTMRETLEHHVPTVFLACRDDWGDVVAVDDVSAGRLATQHLLALGHRRIAYLSIPEMEDRSDVARWQGYREAMEAVKARRLVKISWSPPSDTAEVDGVKRPLYSVLTGSDRLSAVFASNDLAAIYLQEFADRIHVHVPMQLSIVGFDDVPMAGLARISLTTLAQPREQLARVAIDTVTARINGRLQGPPTTTLVEVELVTRGSTGPLI
jgi:DNA-binding LacI/PurR family transcriptional regulator